MSVKVHEAFSIDSFQDRLLWWDDFLGDQLQDEWARGGTATSVVIDAQTGGIVRSTTAATNGNDEYIWWNNVRSLLVTKKATLEVRLKANQATFINPEITLYFDANNYISIFFNEVAGGADNWDIECRDGLITTQDSGVAADTNYHIFRIECHTHGSNHVHFYIDGVETANSPITTNIPGDAGDYFQPLLRLRTRENVAKSMDVDYVVVRQEI